MCEGRLREGGRKGGCYLRGRMMLRMMRSEADSWWREREGGWFLRRPLGGESGGSLLPCG